MLRVERRTASISLAWLLFLYFWSSSLFYIYLSLFARLGSKRCRGRNGLIERSFLLVLFHGVQNGSGGQLQKKWTAVFVWVFFFFFFFRVTAASSCFIRETDMVQGEEGLQRGAGKEKNTVVVGGPLSPPSLYLLYDTISYRSKISGMKRILGIFFSPKRRGEIMMIRMNILCLNNFSSTF